MEDDGQCVIHFPTVINKPLSLLTQSKVNKLLNILPKWSESNKAPESQIAKAALSKLISCKSNYHETCYLRIASESKLARALSSQRKQRVSTSDEENLAERGLLEPKLLRSQSLLKAKKNVLPPVCVICKRASKSRISHYKRFKEPLSQAETKTAGRLVEASKRRQDDALLLQLTHRDCVASEVKYHRSCSKRYLSVLYHRKARNDVPHSNALELFKSFVEKEILEEKKCYRLTTLCTKLNSMVKEQDEHAALYSRQWLRSRLKRLYPKIAFHKSTFSNKSDLVSSADASIHDFVESENQIATNTLTDSSSNDSNSNYESHDSDFLNISVDSMDNNITRTIYHAGVSVRNDLRRCDFTLSWPPKLEELDLAIAESSTPHSLYNLIALITGAAEDIPKPNRKLSTDLDTHRKLLSICADISYLSSKGKTLTPKHAALGLSVRSITGSKYMINILSGMGHIPSYDSLLRLETSVATKQLNIADDVPRGFAKEQFSVLVYDNIDFAEETLSGAGTTHHTNGILFQTRQLTHSKNPTIASNSQHKSTQRSFTPVTNDIVPFYLTNKTGPQHLSGDKYSLEDCREVTKYAHNKDKIYVMNKAVQQDLQLPAWTAYNSKLEKPLPMTRIHYLPIIEASPTDLSTVKAILNDSIGYADKLQLPSIMVVFDQAIYAKAQQIRWKDPLIEKRLVIRLGEFHTTMTFLAVIGKRFSMSGLEDILVESETIAHGSLKGVMSGHMYNRSVRAHKVLFEAMMRLQVIDFIENGECITMSEFEKTLLSMSEADSNDESANQFHEVQRQFDMYVAERCRNSALYTFWNSYIHMVMILLSFIRATREGFWMLHLASLRQMIPWFFAYDRVNYARYAPAYWMEMVELSKSHPGLYNELMSRKGCWTVQRQNTIGFTSIAADQAIEQTLNRESKTSGGLKGITLSRGAVQRWILTQPYKAAVTSQCENMSGLNAVPQSNKEAGHSRMKRDEQEITDVMSVINSMVNPWTTDTTKLVSLSSGAVATDKVANDLLKAGDIGEECATKFMEQRLASRETDLFVTLNNLKLGTFASTIKAKPTQNRLKKQSDRSIFGRLLVVSNQRQIDLKSVLSHSLSPIPASLSSVDGFSLSKCAKSQLLTVIEGHCAELAVYPQENSTYTLIIDAMALIQSLPRSNIPSTFGELAKQILQRIYSLSKMYNAVRVDFVGDKYLNVSIKNIERQRRAKATSQTILISFPEQRIPKQWSKYLGSGVNKEQLQRFLSETWKVTTLDITLTLFVAVTDICEKMTFLPNTPPQVVPVLELTSDHEEADTRLLLHAKHASVPQSPPICIWSPDTDVAILCISHCLDISHQIVFVTGTGNRRRNIDMSAISNHLGQNVSSALIGLHALTGCDTVSSLYGKGKPSCFKALLKSPSASEALTKLGKDWELDRTLLIDLEKFVCDLYGYSGNSSINDTRYDMFCSSASNERNLPPNKDALKQHLMRANYQAAIWRRALKSTISPPSPAGHGWKIIEGSLQLQWLPDDSESPDKLLQLVSCQCKKSQCTSRCSCFSAKLPCTILCQCTDCHNATLDIAESEDSDCEI